MRNTGTLFAKSSDRPPGEAQIIEAMAARAAAGRVAIQYRSLPDGGAVAVVGARPTWLWGFEHGVNARRVAIGNEQLWTIHTPSVQPDGLTGMDLVRLGLERGETAAHALEVIIELVEAHGQDGAGERPDDASGADETGGKAYSSAFLVADPTEAWVMETSDRSWAARRIGGADASVALSNRISLSTDWTRASADVTAAGDFDRWRRAGSPTAHADKRLAVTVPAARAATGEDVGPRELAAVLRHHGSGPWGAPGSEPGSLPTAAAGLPPAVIDRLGTGVSLCMHLTGVQATTSSMIAWLPRDPAESPRGWVAPGSPCTSVFVPTFGVDGIAPELADPVTWERFRALRDRVERARVIDGDGAAALAEIRAGLAPVEAALWDEADELASGAPRVQVAWARGLWPPVDRALAALAV